MLDRNSIIDCKDMADVDEVDVPEWGGTVLIRPLPGIGRDAYERALVQGKSHSAVLVRWCAINGDGKPLFSDADIPFLEQKSARALNRLATRIGIKNGLYPGALEEAEKNSESSQSEDSGT